MQVNEGGGKRNIRGISCRPTLGSTSVCKKIWYGSIWYKCCRYDKGKKGSQKEKGQGGAGELLARKFSLWDRESKAATPDATIREAAREAGEGRNEPVPNSYRRVSVKVRFAVQLLFVPEVTRELLWCNGCYTLYFFVLRLLWAHLHPPAYIGPYCASEGSGNGLVEESASWGCAFSCSDVSVPSQSATLDFQFVLPPPVLIGLGEERLGVSTLEMTLFQFFQFQ